MHSIEKILCPVDFFPGSLRAVQYATVLAKKYSARLVLLHVVDATALSLYNLGRSESELTKLIRKDAVERLEDIARTVRASEVPAETFVRSGSVDEVLISSVSEFRPDLVVMGKHGRRGLGKFLMGSTTERLLRKLPVPVLTMGTTNSSSAKARKHILLTTDFLEGTENALAYALRFASEDGAKLTLLHVLNDMQADISGVYREPLIRSIRRELEEMIPAEARKTCRIEARVLIGRPSRRILPFLKQEKIDLIVMNIHRKTLLDRLSIGSTAEKIISAADVPVLAVPSVMVPKRKSRSQRK